MWNNYKSHLEYDSLGEGMGTGPRVAMGDLSLTACFVPSHPVDLCM